MGIGTSSGAYFDSEFHHQASQWQDGWDNNEQDPEINDLHTEDKNAGSPPSPEQSTTPQPISDKLGGKFVGEVNEDHPDYADWGKTWDSAKNLNGQSPEEYMKTQPEGVEGSTYHGSGMIFLRRKPEPGPEIPMSDNSSGLPIEQVGWRDTLAHLQEKGLLSGIKPLQLDVLTKQQNDAGMYPSGPNPFQTFMATRGQRQQSNIVEPTPSRPLEGEVLPPVRSDHPDFTRLVDQHYNALVEHSATQGNEAWQPRGILPGENLRAYAEREVNRADPDLRYRGHREEPEHDPLEQVPFEPDHTSPIPTYIQRRSDEINKQFETQKVDKKGQISLVDDSVKNFMPDSHSFVFKNDEGVTGDLRLTEIKNGKELYVNWIGAHGRDGPHDLGTSEIRSLLGILKDRFPNAEFMSGFRVSGARYETGRIGDARMRIRPLQAAE